MMIVKSRQINGLSWNHQNRENRCQDNHLRTVALHGSKGYGKLLEEWPLSWPLMQSLESSEKLGGRHPRDALRIAASSIGAEDRLSWHFSLSASWNSKKFYVFHVLIIMDLTDLKKKILFSASAWIWSNIYKCILDQNYFQSRVSDYVYLIC